MRVTLFGLMLAAVTLISCKKDKAVATDEDCSTVISYANDIQPIINSSCVTGLGPGTGCHDGVMDDYDQLNDRIEGNAFQEQVFLQKAMPWIPNDFGIDSLTADELKTLRCWIDQGYPNN